MNCPNDSSALRKTTYKGSEISVCVDCKGVWLDYGVLTEILRVAEPDWPPEKERRILQPTLSLTPALLAMVFGSTMVNC